MAPLLVTQLGKTRAVDGLRLVWPPSQLKEPSERALLSQGHAGPQASGGEEPWEDLTPMWSHYF